MSTTVDPPLRARGSAPANVRTRNGPATRTAPAGAATRTASGAVTRPAGRTSRPPERTARSRPTQVRRRAPRRSRRTYGRASLWKAGRPTVRIIVLVVVCSALLIVAVGRVALLTTVDRAQYTAFGARQRLYRVELTAERGSIFDRNHTELAISVPQTTVWADPRLVQDIAGTAAVLGGVLHFDGYQVELLRASLARAGSEFVYVARQVDDGTAARVKELKLPGIYTLSEPKRFTPAGAVARSIVGATDPDGKGTAGIESQYDKLLTGTKGLIVRERGRDGHTIATGHQQLVPATPGNDVQVTIDQTLQYRAEQLLLAHANELNAAGGGMVTVMDTATGDLLALASVENDPATGTLVVTSKNRPLLDSFEAGSVMKIVPTSAALDLGASEIDTAWELPAAIASADDVIHNAEENMGGQELTFRQILEQSSNIGTVTLAHAVGVPQFEAYLHKFGFGEPTGIAFPSESSGTLPPSAKWYGSQRDTIAYGQGIGTTQVQLAAAMNTIARGGSYVPPRLVQSTVDAQGVEHAVTPATPRTVIQPATAASMASVLEGVVCAKDGTVGSHRQTYLNLPGYRVAGKTGTGFKAQNKGYRYLDPKTGKIKIDNYKDAKGQNHYESSFVGFVPAENPRFTIAVTIDEPPFGPFRFGASAAAPLFAKVAGEALRLGAVPPSDGGECGTGNGNGKTAVKP